MFYIKPVNFKVEKSVLDTLHKQAQTSPIIRATSTYDMWFFPKQLVAKKEVYAENHGNLIFGTGTWSYRNKTEGKALKLILEEYDLNNLIIESELFGQYTFVLVVNNQIKILTDSSGIFNIYKGANNIISSSFLATLYSSQYPCKLNRNAIKEILLTGNLISPDTLVHEIERFYPRVEKNFLADIPITVINAHYLDKIPKYKDEREAIEGQINTLNDLLGRFSSLVLNNKTDIGITGGLDSRLLWACALKKWPKNTLNIYTNSRFSREDKKVLDEPISLDVANSIGLDLKMGWMKDPKRLSKEELEKTLEVAYVFSDAHIRMHIQYFEAYNTPDFKKKVLNESSFNLSGIGGEQYRNQERFIGSTCSGRKFIEYKTIKFVAGNAIIDGQRELVDYIYSKSKKRVGSDKDKWTHYEVKKYYNEIINGDRLGARNNMENKLSWFLSPFAEPKVGNAAYGLIPFLTTSSAIQAKMITYLNTNLSKIRTDYGFTPSEGPSVRTNLSNLMLALTPWPLFYQVRVSRKYSNTKQQTFAQFDSNSVMHYFIDTVRNYLPEINMESLLIRPDLMPLIVNMGYFLSKEIEKGHVVE